MGVCYVSAVEGGSGAGRVLAQRTVLAAASAGLEITQAVTALCLPGRRPLAPPGSHCK